jgi:hypothetical protein
MSTDAFLILRGRRSRLLLLALTVCIAFFVAGPSGALLRPTEANAACASGALETSFESNAVEGEITTPSEVDCYTISATSPGDALLVRARATSVFSAEPFWRLTNSGGATNCESDAYAPGAVCRLEGTDPWNLVVFDRREEGTFSYQLNAHRVTSPEGCSPFGESEAWSFSSSRLNGSIDEALGGSCYTFSRGAGESDGAYWFRTASTSGAFTPRWTVYGPSGSQECSGYGGDPVEACSFTASGNYVVTVEDPNGSGTGSFFLKGNRLTEPLGCGSLPSTAFDAEAFSGNISNVGEVDCLAIPNVASGDKVTLATKASGLSSGNPGWAIVNGSGTAVCNDSAGYLYQSTCALDAPGPWYLLMYDRSAAGTFAYSVAVRRTTDPQGCTPLGAPDIWSYAAPRKNGSISTPLGTNCYTFSRAESESDGAYWIRALRTSGTLQPTWTVYGPSGTTECTGSAPEPDQSCQLIASGEFALMVSGGSGTGSYFLDPKRLTDPQGCSPLSSSAFGAPPEEGGIESAGAVDCYSVPSSLAGHAATIGLSTSNVAATSPAWALVNANGSIACRFPYWQFGSPCQLPGSSERSLLVYDGAGGTGTFEYDLALRRLTNPQGCQPLGEPAVWSFGAPRLTGLIGPILGARCYTFTRQEGESDSRYWIRSLRTAGTIDPSWNVYEPSGALECSGASGPPESSCGLQGSGTHTLVVEDSSGNGSGEYALVPRQLNDAKGCSSLPSVVFGIPATSGSLSVGGETDCYSLPATDGDELNFELSGAASTVAVFDDGGSVVCPPFSAHCEIEGTGPFNLAVYSTSNQTGSYTLKANCENVPCGQVSTALTEATPKRLGRSRFTTVLLRGHDLDLLDKVALVQEGSAIEGEIQEATPGARAVEVRFDLRGAAPGIWSLEGHFLDGSTKTLGNSTTIEAAREGAISLETIGRETFRVGASNTVTVVATNTGNVDAVGVPVVLRGLPAEATITPAFQLYSPSGSGTEVSFTKTPYSQSLETLSEEGETVAPFLISRVPAGRSVTMEFSISLPTASTYQLQVFAGRCLATDASAGSASLAATTVSSALSPEAVNCAGDYASKLLGEATGAVFGSCGTLASDAFVRAAVDAKGGEKFWSWGHFTGWLANGALCAGEVLVPESKLIKLSLAALKGATSLTGTATLLSDCLDFASQAILQQRAVFSVDPNEIEGPAGVGAQHYIQANVPLSYEVLFENIASATAAAQKIKITDELDPGTFLPSTVLFSGVGFGSTYYQPPFPVDSLDTIIDLRPQRNLEVHVAAGMNGNVLHLELEALDPDTSEPPGDPELGVLPPNVAPPEGEGRLLFTVAPQPLPSGSMIENNADIQFDQNPPIATPTWTNVVDKQPPQPTLQAEAAETGLAAHVSWGGSDDAAGITLWKLEVSREGGPFELWRAAGAAGSDDFEAPEAGTYDFRATAYDGAGNTGQSALAGVSLTPSQPSERPPTEGPTPPPTAAPALTPAQAAAATPPHRRRLRCKKGSHKKRVHGKIRCVPAKKNPA